VLRVKPQGQATGACSGPPPNRGSSLTSSRVPTSIWRQSLDTTGTVTVAADHVRVDLAQRTYTPVLIDAGFPELNIPIPWWGRKTLRFGFPPR
jgi:hypothetical protein